MLQHGSASGAQFETPALPVASPAGTSSVRPQQLSISCPPFHASSFGPVSGDYLPASVGSSSSWAAFPSYAVFPPGAPGPAMSSGLTVGASPTDVLPAQYLPPGTFPALTVGDMLQRFPSPPSSSYPPSSSTLAVRGFSGGGFESERILDGPIGLAPRVKPFIAKLNHLVSHPESYQDCVVWDSAGEAFVINANKRFVREVLPRLFGHANAASFTRQLNVYGFRRLTPAELLSRVDVASTENYSAWSHPHFTRDDKTTQHLMTPRPSRARQLKKAEKQERLEREHGTKERRAPAGKQVTASPTTDGDGAGLFPLPASSWASPPTDGMYLSDASHAGFHSTASPSPASFVSPGTPPSAFLSLD